MDKHLNLAHFSFFFQKSARERRERYDAQRKAGNLPQYQAKSYSTNVASKENMGGNSKTPGKAVQQIVVTKEDPALRKERDELKEELGRTTEELRETSSAKESLQEELVLLQQSQAELETALIAEKEAHSEAQESVAMQQTAQELLQEELARVTQEARAEIAELEMREETLQAASASLEATVATLDATLAEEREDRADVESDLRSEQDARSRAEEIQMELQGRVRELEGQVREGEALRRELHQEMQELRGNIRVLCRVRPMLPSDGEAQPLDLTLARGGQTLELEGESRPAAMGGERPGESQLFKFDRVFGPAASQAQVFEELQHLVQSALDGYSACIFTYGQTGSGKTHTMEGPADASAEEAGMIARSVDLIFAHTQRLAQQGWHYDMEATFVEIYNEKLRDLLDASSGKLNIQHNRDGTTEILNSRQVPVATPADLHALLRTAASTRSVGSTQSNARSSRSHSVFSLKLFGENRGTGASVSGILHLVDLAGSERLSKSEATGERLTCLGDVIAALAAGDAAHVPYRNSKLTYLLQNSLGGAASKTLMFVQVSPSADDISETISSLRFATKVNSAEIGVARKTGKGKRK